MNLLQKYRLKDVFEGFIIGEQEPVWFINAGFTEEEKIQNKGRYCLIHSRTRSIQVFTVECFKLIFEKIKDEEI